MADGTCSVPGCPNPRRTRGYCPMHYWRWKTHGDPGEAGKRRKPSPPVCAFEGCERKPKALNLCDLHYKRQWKHGDPAVGATRAGADDVSYFAVHARLGRRYGPASRYPCRMCGGVAYDWAYDHGDPQERRREDGAPYSLDLARYLPTCRPCHRRLDAEHRH